MAGPIRNSCVARGFTVDDINLHPIYTVPTGYVLLLKSISIVQTTFAGPVADGWWLSIPDGSFKTMIVNIALELNKPVVINDWWAVNGDDKIYSMSQGGPVNYWLSGALLPFAPGLPAVLAPLPAPGGPTQPAPVGYDPASATERSPISI